jgi:hypothetical protein
MNERRIKRSAQPDEAIQYLLESLLDRSDARAVALVDEDRRVLAGVGMPRDLSDLRALAGPVGRGEACTVVDELDASTDAFSRRISVGPKAMYLAAIGTRMRRFGDAANAVARIATRGTPD